MGQRCAEFAAGYLAQFFARQSAKRNPDDAETWGCEVLPVGRRAGNAAGNLAGIWPVFWAGSSSANLISILFRKTLLVFPRQGAVEASVIDEVQYVLSPAGALAYSLLPGERKFFLQSSLDRLKAELAASALGVKPAEPAPGTPTRSFRSRRRRISSGFPPASPPPGRRDAALAQHSGVRGSRPSRRGVERRAQGCRRGRRIMTGPPEARGPGTGIRQPGPASISRSPAR